MRVAIRRNIRVGDLAGTPIEDLGIIPNIMYEMTRKDLLEKNADLLKKASEILATMPIRQLDVVLLDQDGSMEIDLNTFGISRVDIYVDERPVLSQYITDVTNKIRIESPGSSAQKIEIVGLVKNEIVAARKLWLQNP